MKKLLAIFLAVVFIFTALPLCVFTFKASAATSGYIGYCKWALDGTVLTISGKGDMVDFDAVTNPAPWGNNITEVIIKKGVTNIGNEAFSNAENLEKITIPNSVKSIGSNAFYKCMNLKTITIPDSVTAIGNCAFFGTGYYNDDDNWENGVLYISKHLIEAKTSISGSYIIKEGTLTIADWAFIECLSLKSVIIPDSTISIGDSAFYDCNALININLPDSLIRIGEKAFYNCTSLVSVTIPNGITTISYSMFYSCNSLTSITIPNSVTRIEPIAFDGCESLTSVYITDLKAWCEISFEYLGDGNPLQYGAKLYLNKELVVSADIPMGTSRIGDAAFRSYRYLTSITIPNSVKSIAMNAFEGCDNLESVNYLGSREEWEKINVSYGNDQLLEAEMVFAHSEPFYKSGNGMLFLILIFIIAIILIIVSKKRKKISNNLK